MTDQTIRVGPALERVRVSPRPGKTIIRFTGRPVGGSGGDVPSSRTITAGPGLTGGGSLAANRTISADFGTGAGKVTQGNDSRLSDARTPTAHKASHATAGSDPIAPADIGAATAAQGALADSALQPSDLDFNEGTGLIGESHIPASIARDTEVTAAVSAHAGATDPHGDRAAAVALVDDLSGVTNAAAARTNLGLGTAASTPATDYATSAQGAKADTAVQPARTITAGTGLTGGGDLSANRTLAVAYGTTGTTAAAGNDARLSDARNPSAHKASHQDGGADELALDGSQITTGTVAIARIASGTPNGSKFVRDDGVLAVPPPPGGTGDVSGPASSVDGKVVLFDGTTGKAIKDSGITLGTAASTASSAYDAAGAAAAAQAAAIAASQPVDSDLTAIAALTTTTFGRSLLTQADAAATRTTLGLGTAATSASSAFETAGAAAAAQAASQPLDSDLTSIAALTTTSFGRSFLALADAAAGRTLLGLGSLATASTITSSDITDGTIVNADVNAAAAIALSKLATDPLARANHTGTQAQSTVTNLVTDLAARQPLDAELTALAGLTSASDRLPYFTGSGTASLATFTAAGRALVDDANAAAQRTTLGLGTAATTASTAYATAAQGALAAAAAPLLVSISAQTASYTLVLGDGGKVVEMSNASANNLTVPPNSSVAFPIGTIIEVCQTGAGATTIVAGSGVTIRNVGALRAQWASASLRKRATDEWVLSGDLA